MSCEPVLGNPPGSCCVRHAKSDAMNEASAAHQAVCAPDPGGLADPVGHALAVAEVEVAGHLRTITQALTAKQAASDRAGVLASSWLGTGRCR